MNKIGLTPRLLSVLLILPLIFSACAPATPKSETGPIKIGGVFNLTGGMASLDGPALNGAKLALKQVNDKGGVLGRKLELLSYDGKTDVTASTNVTTQLVEVDKVPAIIGLCDTTYMLAAGPIAQKAGIPFITVCATGPIIPKTVGNDMFLVAFGDNVQAAAAAEYSYKNLGKTAYILANKGMDYTKLLAQYFKERFTEMGGQILAEDAYDMGDTDFSSQLTRVKKLDPQPDLLYIAAGPDECGSVVKQAREAGIMLPIMGGDAYDTSLLVQLAGAKNTENVYFSDSVGLAAKSGMTEAFIQAYTAEYGHEPEGISAAQGYDAGLLIADAIKRAGTTDSKAIRDALQNTKGFEGVTGTITYPPNDGVPQKEAAIMKVVNGVFVPQIQFVPEKVPTP